MTVTPPDWEEVRRIYETTDLSVPKICARFGITATAFRAARENGDWTNRPSAAEAAKARRQQLAPPPDAPSVLEVLVHPAAVGPPSSEAVVVEAEAEAAKGSKPKPALKRKQTVAQRRAFVTRLTAAIETKLALLERRFARELAASASGKDNPTTPADAERDSRTISLIIKNLEQVSEYGHAPQPGPHLRGAAAKSAALAATQLAD